MRFFLPHFCYSRRIDTSEIDMPHGQDQINDQVYSEPSSPENLEEIKIEIQRDEFESFDVVLDQTNASMQSIEKNNSIEEHQNSETHSNKEERDDLELLFIAFSKTVKKMSRKRQAIAKMKIAKVIMDQELLDIEEDPFANDDEVCPSSSVVESMDR